MVRPAGSPETVRRWHPEALARRGTYPSLGPGAPPLDRAVRELIVRVGEENPPADTEGCRESWYVAVCRLLRAPCRSSGERGSHPRGVTSGHWAHRKPALYGEPAI